MCSYRARTICTGRRWMSISPLSPSITQRNIHWLAARGLTSAYSRRRRSERVSGHEHAAGRAVAAEAPDVTRLSKERGLRTGEVSWIGRRVAPRTIRSRPSEPVVEGVALLERALHHGPPVTDHEPAPREDGVDHEVLGEEHDVGVLAGREGALPVVDPEDARDVRADERERLGERQPVGPDGMQPLAVKDAGRRVVE